MFEVLIAGSILSLLITTALLIPLLKYLGVTQELWQRSFILAFAIIGLSTLTKLFIPALSTLITILISGLILRKVLIIDYLKAFAIPCISLSVSWLVVSGLTATLLVSFRV
ncbi:hypothetical protein [Litoribacillus peritrichatus]|uniref:Uncharacterized protein n=1 Tax=Litoribacillus peritrichatus TaxID=718191 RepID=A0ABP7NA93_9GAMM